MCDVLRHKQRSRHCKGLSFGIDHHLELLGNCSEQIQLLFSVESSPDDQSNHMMRCWGFSQALRINAFQMTYEFQDVGAFSFAK